MRKIKEALDSFEQLIDTFLPQGCNNERNKLNEARKELEYLSKEWSKVESVAKFYDSIGGDKFLRQFNKQKEVSHDPQLQLPMYKTQGIS